MPASKKPSSPSISTIKRLFATSGNLCAFPSCTIPLIHSESGSVVGEICHIKGARPLAPRHDAEQSDEERHGYDNLLLLCSMHHKVIDDDPSEYTVDRLVQMKAKHEEKHSNKKQKSSEAFASVAINNFIRQQAIVTSVDQKGGQTAQVIYNNYTSPKTEEQVIEIEGLLEWSADLTLIQAIGCPGMRLTVVCRSTRPAKIRSAHLLVKGVDMMRSLQEGFDTDFGYEPAENSIETLVVDLIPLSRPNATEGYILNQDEVARFFYPLPMPATVQALNARREDVSLAIRYLDNSEEPVLLGDQVVDLLAAMYAAYKDSPGVILVPVSMNCRVRAKSMPNVAPAVGAVNTKALIINDDNAIAAASGNNAHSSPETEATVSANFTQPQRLLIAKWLPDLQDRLVLEARSRRSIRIERGTLERIATCAQRTSVSETTLDRQKRERIVQTCASALKKLSKSRG